MNLHLSHIKNESAGLRISGDYFLLHVNYPLLWQNWRGLSAFKSPALKHTENISKHASLGICRSWRQHWCETAGRLPWRLPASHRMYHQAPMDMHQEAAAANGWGKKEKEPERWHGWESKGQGNKRPGRSAMPCGLGNVQGRSKCRPALARACRFRRAPLTPLQPASRMHARARATPNRSCKKRDREKKSRGARSHASHDLMAERFSSFRPFLHGCLVQCWGMWMLKIFLNPSYISLHMYSTDFGGLLLTQKFQCMLHAWRRNN